MELHDDYVKGDTVFAGSYNSLAGSSIPIYLIVDEDETPDCQLRIEIWENGLPSGAMLRAEGAKEFDAPPGDNTVYDLGEIEFTFFDTEMDLWFTFADAICNLETTLDPYLVDYLDGVDPSKLTYWAEFYDDFNNSGSSVPEVRQQLDRDQSTLSGSAGPLTQDVYDLVIRIEYEYSDGRSDNTFILGVAQDVNLVEDSGTTLNFVYELRAEVVLLALQNIYAYAAAEDGSLKEGILVEAFSADDPGMTSPVDACHTGEGNDPDDGADGDYACKLSLSGNVAEPLNYTLVYSYPGFCDETMTITVTDTIMLDWVKLQPGCP